MIHTVNLADIEELVLAKHDFEKYLLENHIINNKLSIDEFLDKYALKGFGKYMYKKEYLVIPFSLICQDEETYLFYSVSKNVDTTRFLEYFKEHDYKLKMKEIKINNIDDTKQECIVCEDKFFVLV